MTSKALRTIFGLLCGILLSKGAFAQTGLPATPPFLSWDNLCVDPTTTQTLSNYVVYELADEMFAVQVGMQGTYFSYGGKSGCFGFGLSPVPPGLYGEGVASTAANVAGSMGFSYGPDMMLGLTSDGRDVTNANTGSVQSTDDDYMVLNFGGPYGSGNPWSYTMIMVDGAKVALGNFASLTFQGLSYRYTYAEQTISPNILVSLRVDLIADAARIQWRLVNQDTTNHSLGLWFGQWNGILMNPNGSHTGWAGQRYRTAGVSGFPSTQGYVSNFDATTKNIYITAPGNNPPVTEVRLKRSTNAATFPSYFNIEYSQNVPYGLRVENGPYDSTIFDTQVHGGPLDGTQIGSVSADEIVWGTEHYLLGGPTGTSAATFPDQTFPDVFPGISDINPYDDFGWIQKWYDTGTSFAPGTERDIVQYFRSTWSNAVYTLPYAAVVDAPQIFQPSLSNPQVLSPSSATVRAYVDNTAGYGDIRSGTPLSGVRVTLTFPASSGVTLSSGDQPQQAIQSFQGVQQNVVYSTKTISQIAPRSIDHVDFTISPSNVVTGNIPYTVTITSTPGPVRTLSGTIYASVTPRLNLQSGANLVSVPWDFPDNSWTYILGLQPSTFAAYSWDAVNQGYIPSTSANRGTGQWLVVGQAFSPLALNANATIPPVSAGTSTTGNPVAVLNGGWNLIGNPYSYPIRLGELAGVSEASNLKSFLWDDLVSQGFVSGSVATWDPVAQSYTSISGDDALLQPQQGYWFYVPTTAKLTITWPSVTMPGILPVTSLQTTTWNQDVSRWRLNLVASTTKTVDAGNYLGHVPTAAELNTMVAYKPPMSPVSNVSLSVDQTVNSKTVPAAQAYSTSTAAGTYKVHIYSKDGGNVKFTWPNLGKVPSSLQFRLVDSAAGATRNMRQTSGYDFVAQKGSTRDFLVQVTPATAAQAVIGNVIATGSGRGPLSSYSISYTLGAPATTSVRILSGTGREIYSITRGRSDLAGSATVVWNLRDSANRAVAPGTYQVEVLAETTDGERQRRSIPINVVR